MLGVSIFTEASRVRPVGAALESGCGVVHGAATEKEIPLTGATHWTVHQENGLGRHHDYHINLLLLFTDTWVKTTLHLCHLHYEEAGSKSRKRVTWK